VAQRSTRVRTFGCPRIRIEPDTDGHAVVHSCPFSGGSRDRYTDRVAPDNVNAVGDGRTSSQGRPLSGRVRTLCGDARLAASSALA
jgi:hypothetical protein